MTSFLGQRPAGRGPQLEPDAGAQALFLAPHPPGMLGLYPGPPSFSLLLGPRIALASKWGGHTRVEKAEGGRVRGDGDLGWVGLSGSGTRRQDGDAQSRSPRLIGSLSWLVL